MRLAEQLYLPLSPDEPDYHRPVAHQDEPDDGVYWWALPAPVWIEAAMLDLSLTWADLPPVAHGDDPLRGPFPAYRYPAWDVVIQHAAKLDPNTPEPLHPLRYVATVRSPDDPAIWMNVLDMVLDPDLGATDPDDTDPGPGDPGS